MAVRSGESRLRLLDLLQAFAKELLAVGVGRLLAKELLNYAWFAKKDWQAEIKHMLSSGLKYELDALANKDFQFLTKTYLPRKLKEEDWLD